MDSVFHEGELEVQRRAGETEGAELNSSVVDDRILGGALPFLKLQRMLGLGAVDARGQLWATLLFGQPGVANSADGRALILDRRLLLEPQSDPAWSALGQGSDVGLLAIELSSRRRLRINGTVATLSADKLELAVREAYPNCPKYIQRRHLSTSGPLAPGESLSSASGRALDRLATRLLALADTLFVASLHPQRGADLSHRGGLPGFVRVVDGRTLRLPDYPGNSMFNTFGNLAVDDRAGLCVPDFEAGLLLQMTGHARVFFDQPEDPAHPTGGTGRYWEFRLDGWRTSALPTGLAWEFLDDSRFSPRPERP